MEGLTTTEVSRGETAKGPVRVIPPLASQHHQMLSFQGLGQISECLLPGTTWAGGYVGDSFVNASSEASVRPSSEVEFGAFCRSWLFIDRVGGEAGRTCKRKEREGVMASGEKGRVMNEIDSVVNGNENIPIQAVRLGNGMGIRVLPWRVASCSGNGA
eukprot:g43778.t1